MTASGQNLIKPCWTFISLPTHSPAAPSCMLPCVQNELHDSDSYKDKKANDDQKGESLIKCRWLNKEKNLINELTSSRVLKKVTNMHKCTHTLFIKLNPTPITFYVAPNQCDYWETLNVR